MSRLDATNSTVSLDIEDIQALTLPPAISDLTTEYTARIGHRNGFIWKWLYAVFPPIRLSTVDDSRTEIVRCQKVLLTLFITLLDDLTDVHGDKQTFDQARKIPFPGTTADSSTDGVQQSYLEFAQTVWDAFHSTLTDAARYDEFKNVFFYDLRQAINAMDYGWLLNDYPELTNTTGSDIYGPHNMVLFGYAAIDLMHSPNFNCADLGILRECIWDAQRLARIGNWVTTWEREIREGDYTSGVVIRALTNGVVTIEELESDAVPDAQLITRIHDEDIEEQYLNEWDDLYAELLNRNYRTKSVDIPAYVRGMKTVRKLHLASRGHK